jgi:hypothetical protein
VEIYRRLGFQMTPRGYHTLGSMNHLAIFGTEYLELIAVAPGGTGRTDILRYPIGLNGLVFGTEDSAAVHAALAAADVPVTPPREFSRPVELAGGARDATFRTVHLAQEAIPAGRIYFCHHLTRDLVWRDEWRHHPNGAVGVARAVIAARDPEAPAGVFARMFGADAVRKERGGFRLTVGLTVFDMLNPAEVEAEFGDAAPADERAQYMASLTIRTRSLAQAAGALRSGGMDVRKERERLLVPATQTMGVALVFQE